MSKSKNSPLNVAVSVWAPQSNEIKASKTGNGFTQNLGSCRAKISIVDGDNEIELFGALSGSVRMYYKNMDDVKSGKGMITVGYENSRESTTQPGKYFPCSEPSELLSAMLYTKTLEAFNKGYAASDRIEDMAKVLGEDNSDKLVNMAAEAMKKAAAFAREATVIEHVAEKSDAKSAVEADLLEKKGNDDVQ